MEIRNKNDVELAYIIIKCYEKNGDDEYKDKVDDIKRKLRVYLNRPSSDSRVIVCASDWDSYLELVELPHCLTDEADARYWFEYNEVLRISPSIYDCTGHLFTRWYKLFKRRGTWWAYHRVAMDV